MEWLPSGKGGYTLGLTAEEVTHEKAAEELEARSARRDLANSLSEIRRFSIIPSPGRAGELQNLQTEYITFAKIGERATTFRMLGLNRSITALTSPGFLELGEPALTAPNVDAESLLSGKPGFASSDPADGLPILGLPTISAMLSGSKAVDAVAVTQLSGGNALKVQLLIKRADGSLLNATAPTWPLYSAPTQAPNPMEQAMRDWSQDPSADALQRALKPEPNHAPPSLYCAHKFGRAEHLLYLADHLDMPVVGDAFRLSFTDATWLKGRTLGEWLDSYRAVAPKSGLAGGDYVRADKGWLMFHQDHWWKYLKQEVPERVLAPLEAKALPVAYPLPLDGYVKLAAGVTDAQVEQLMPGRFPAALVKFPLGNFASVVEPLRLIAKLDSGLRLLASTTRGVDLSEAGTDVRKDIYDTMLKLAFAGHGDYAVLRTLIPNKDFVTGLRLYIADNSNVAAGGKGLRVLLTFGTSSGAEHGLVLLCLPDQP